MNCHNSKQRPVFSLSETLFFLCQILTHPVISIVFKSNKNKAIVNRSLRWIFISWLKPAGIQKKTYCPQRYHKATLRSNRLFYRDITKSTVV